MAFGRRSKDAAADPNEATTKAGPKRKQAFLDAGCEVAGQLRFSDDVLIEGRVEGEITAARSVSVAESAEIDATIDAETLEVFGTVMGDIRVKRQTVLHKTAHVEGEIQTSGIVIEEGARFKGCILIGPDEEPAGQMKSLAKDSSEDALVPSAARTSDEMPDESASQRLDQAASREIPGGLRRPAVAFDRGLVAVRHTARPNLSPEGQDGPVRAD